MASDGSWDLPSVTPKIDLAAEMADPPPRRAPSVFIDREQFARACAHAGTPFTDEDVAAVFEKYGVVPSNPATRVAGDDEEAARRKREKQVDIERFADKVLAAPRRELGQAPSAPIDGGPADGFEGKISYPPCNTPVMAPTGWESYHARRSADAPKESLRLEWTYGASVAGVGGMLQFAPRTGTGTGTGMRRRTRGGGGGGDDDDARESTSASASGSKSSSAGAGHWVYVCGAVGVAYDVETQTQTHFRGHDEGIVCLATHPSGRWAATGQAGRIPCAVIWEVESGKEIARLRHDVGDGAVIALAFSPGDGSVGGGHARIVTICADNKHTTRVWDWGGDPGWRPRPRRLCAGVGLNGAPCPPKVRGAAWSPALDRFVTFGAKHVKLWTPTEDAPIAAGGVVAAAPPTGSRANTPVMGLVTASGSGATADARGAGSAAGTPTALPAGNKRGVYSARPCVFGAAAGFDKGASDALCGAFLPGGGGRKFITGHRNGFLYLWSDRTCERTIDAHGANPVKSIAVAVVAADGDGDGDGDDDEDAVEVISAGGGGAVRRWEVVRGVVLDDAASTRTAQTPTVYPPGDAAVAAAMNAAPPAVAAVAATPAGDVAVVTAVGDLWLMPRVGSPRPMTHGCAGPAHDVCWHPRSEGIFAVAGGSARVMVRDARTRDAVGAAWALDPVPGKATACAFRRVLLTLVPIRPRRRGERRSLRTLPGVSLRPSLAFKFRPRSLSTPTDAFQLHPDVRLERPSAPPRRITSRRRRRATTTTTTTRRTAVKERPLGTPTRYRRRR